MSEWVAVVGLNYPDPQQPGAEKRVEPGEIVSDLSDEQAAAFLACGAIAAKE